LHIDHEHVAVTFPSTETSTPRRSASPIPYPTANPNTDPN
jgi:hypothetical protein